MDYSSVFVCLMGMGTVFFGLICLIVITYFMSFLCEAKTHSSAAAAPAPTSIQPELVAAISAAVAEELGTDITCIRILSIKAA